MKPPSEARVAAVVAAAQRAGWKEQSLALRVAAQRAYDQEKLSAAAGWFYLYRWSALFAATEDEFLPRWIQAVQNARVAHGGMSTQYRSRSPTLGAYLTPECQAWLLGNPQFSEEFFSVLQPVDYLPAVFRILSELHAQDPRTFEEYAQLALAIAVVHDVPQPPDWPHVQVSTEALPRRWPSAVQAFRWWVAEDKAARTYHKLTKLAADELKFVIDSAAPLDELEWSQHVANYPVDQLHRAYTMIAYRQDRAANSRPIWTEKDYSLPTILGSGGICVDQAYFASHVGKARGVPTLLFQGASSNGRHAWFGFLDSKQKWRLDAGRYAEQRFVTGVARDPQTWGAITDHQLKFLAERFRSRPSFRQSQIHAEFSRDFLNAGDYVAAERAAQKAVTAESRNYQAWEVLLAAGEKIHSGSKKHETTLTAAVRAFDRYPDLELRYSKWLAQSLRSRGEVAAADAEERRISRKYQGDRSDVSLHQARERLLRAIATQPVNEQINVYNQTLADLGRGAGIAFFDQIVVTFVDHLSHVRKVSEARQAAERARATLKVEPTSQLEQEFAALLKRVRAKE